MDCGCGLNQKEKDLKRFQSLASQLPLIKGSIIKADGTVVSLYEYLGVETTPIDAQTAKAQVTYPYIRDKVIFEDGRTCALTALIEALLDRITEAGLVYTNELRLTYAPITAKDWGEEELNGSQGLRYRKY